MDHSGHCRELRYKAVGEAGRKLKLKKAWPHVRGQHQRAAGAVSCIGIKNWSQQSPQVQEVVTSMIRNTKPWLDKDMIPTLQGSNLYYIPRI